ncbi:hypothetical protein PED39_02405 [Methanomassiliicoccales archaeon LGM-RCC1]|nr:hypothetical protein PED39_02405 [Methanomassiliicoccales archaeon LGM-RCC1]
MKSSAVMLALLMVTVSAVNAVQITSYFNSIESEYCVVTCDSEGIVFSDGAVWFTDNGPCTLSYTDSSGIPADAEFTFYSDAEDGTTVELIFKAGSVSRIVSGTFSDGVCTVTYKGMSSGVSFELSGRTPEADGEVLMKITAVPQGTGRSSTFVC